MKTFDCTEASRHHVITGATINPDKLHQKFIEAALALDAGIVEPFISEDMQLQDLDKYNFLSYLQGHFDSFIQECPENYRVEIADYKCGKCLRGEALAGFNVFAGPEYKPYAHFGYYIEKDASGGNTKDIFLCKEIMGDNKFSELLFSVLEEAILQMEADIEAGVFDVE